MNAAQLNLNPISQIEPVVIVIMIAIFIATYFALRRVFVLPYVAVMEKRERLFEHAEESREEAAKIERAAREDAQLALDEAARAGEELRSASRDRCDAYQHEKLTEATTSASALLEQGRAQISAARAEQSVALRRQVMDCVGVACERLLGSADDSVVETAVDRAIARRMG